MFANAYYAFRSRSSSVRNFSNLCDTSIGEIPVCIWSCCNCQLKKCTPQQKLFHEGSRKI